MSNSQLLKKLTKELTADLNPRQREVVKSRYGLGGGQCLTLAEIGSRYDLSRERVRQIEAATLAKIGAKFANGPGADFVKSTVNILKRFNGVREEGMLLKADLRCAPADLNNMRFVLEASGKFSYHPEDDNFYAHWYLDAGARKTALSFINRFRDQLNKNRAVADQPTNSLEANYVTLSKSFAFNPFGEFGLSEWPEIIPRSSRDWAYLVLKREKQPLHFGALAEVISRHRQTKKRVNVQTVHNELIKDERFVLVGRGTYGLAEHGFVPGTAKDILRHFLKEHGPLPANDVIQLALQQRMFKHNTLLINLQNKNHFQRLEDGRYAVKEV